MQINEHGGGRRMVLALLLILVAGKTFAADDAVQKAMRSYEKHRYEEAGRELRSALPSLPQGKQPQAQLVLGMIYLRSATLHHSLADLSSAVNTDYLKRLSAQRGGGRSRYSELYRGLAELEAGRLDRADAAFRSFVAAAQDRRAAARAKIGQGRAAAGRGRGQEAVNLWAGISPRDPEGKAMLADAVSAAGQRDPDPSALCDAAIADASAGGKPLPIDVITGCLGAYTRAGRTDRGTGLLERADLKGHSFHEKRGTRKELFFYDVRLLSNLASFFLAASIISLEKAANDPQVGNVANYYLGEAYLRAGNEEAAARATAAFLATPQAPPQYRNRALVRQAEILYQKGKRSDAIGTWEDLIRNQPKEPDLLADIVNTCARLAIDCARPVQAAAVAAETGEGKRFAAVNIGLGGYYLSRKDASRALTYLEAGRDKGNKNKIEFNDPEMLTALADGYYRTKKYSEALEIFFEMSKQFPQVRQIQEALQGIYSMEHKSAGDVKIN